MVMPLAPKLLTGKIVQLTEMSAKIELKGKMGIVHLPLRSFFTDHPMAEGDLVEIYISYANVLPKQENEEK